MLTVDMIKFNLYTVNPEKEISCIFQLGDHSSKKMKRTRVAKNRKTVSQYTLPA